MKSLAKYLALPLLVASVMACSKSNSTEPTNNDNNNTDTTSTQEPSSFSAMIGSGTFVVQQLSATSFAGFNIVANGKYGSYDAQVAISMQKKEVGEQQMNPYSPLGRILIYTGGSTPNIKTSTSGKLTITEVSSKVKGTFAFVCDDGTNVIGSFSVNNK